MTTQHPSDPSNLAQVIRDFPQQFAAGLALADATKIAARGIQEVIVAGMGGSALPADLVAEELLGELPLRVHREYAIRPAPTAHSLLIVSSFSGTTEETLAAFAEGQRSRAPMLAISHGGTLADVAREAGVPHIELPPVIQPRYATGLFVSTMLGALGNMGAIIDRRRMLEALGAQLAELDLEATGMELAEAIGERVPHIYSSEHLRAVARIWKIKINENAKTQAYWNVFPELNHNEMVGFTNLRLRPAFLLLRSPDDHPRIQKRMGIFAELLAERGAFTRILDVPPGPYLFQAFATIILGDWVSYYLAVNAGVDPTPVDMVEHFKKRMAA